MAARCSTGGLSDSVSNQDCQHKGGHLALSCAGNAPVNAAESVAPVLNGCLEDVQHHTGLAEEEGTVPCLNQLLQESNYKHCFTGAVHTCRQAHNSC